MQPHHGFGYLLGFERGREGGKGGGVTRSAVGTRGPGVKLHAGGHIYFRAAEELLGSGLQAEVAGYAWVWCQKG